MQRRSHFVYVIAGVAILSAVACIPAISQWSGATYDTLTHDALRDEVDKQALALDNDGKLHAVWRKENTSIGGWRVFYSVKAPSGSWLTPQEITDSTMLIFRTALAVHAPTRMPYVAYERESALPREIFIARGSGGVWIHERITANATEDLAPTIALDSAGFVHLAWIGQDTSNNWKIMYATNRGGTFQRQLLTGSELGPFGSGAEPFIAVTASGIAHIFYRGGDFGTYRIHHAWNAQPGGTSWTYEIITTPNGNDFTAQAAIDGFGTIHLLASGNDGFGFPPRIYYLTKPPSGNWSVPDHANQGRSGWGGSLTIDRFGKAHVTIDEVSGNIYTGNLFYATNTTGTWTNTPILADGKTYNGTLILDAAGKGHAVAVNGETFQTQEILVVHSAGALTSVSDADAFVPVGIVLYQNYPNPFNPSTHIPFTVRGSGFVSLKVCDILGREVRTLVNDYLRSGNYEVTWDATGMSSGVYFFRLDAGGSSTTKRMLLVR
jgi:hypothetical protein